MAVKAKSFPPARVYVVNDQPLVRRGICLLLSRDNAIEVCGEAADAAHALAEIRDMKPDLAIVDLFVRGKRGLGLIRALRLQCPSVRILVFSMYEDEAHVNAARLAGAHGYVSKERGTEKLIGATHRLLRRAVPSPEDRTRKTRPSRPSKERESEDSWDVLPVSGMSGSQPPISKAPQRGTSSRPERPR